MSPDQWNRICHRCSWPSTSYFFLNFTSCLLPLTFPRRTQINLVTVSPNQKQIHKTSPDPWVSSSHPWHTASREEKLSLLHLPARPPAHWRILFPRLPSPARSSSPRHLDKDPVSASSSLQNCFLPLPAPWCPVPSHVSPPPATSVRGVFTALKPTSFGTSATRWSSDPFVT